MFNNLGNLADLMRNAGKIRETVEKATESLGQLAGRGDVGRRGGVGQGQRPARAALGPDRPEAPGRRRRRLLEDLVTAAVNQALTKAREAAAKSISSLAGGLPMPGPRRACFGPGRRRGGLNDGAGSLGALDRLIEAFGRLPGIGAKSAERLAHHILKCPAEEALALAEAIREVKERVRHCGICFHLTEAEQPLCAICRDPRRDPALVCVVEQPRDLMALERAGTYRGRLSRPARPARPAPGDRARAAHARRPGGPGPLGRRPRGDHGHQPQPRRATARPCSSPTAWPTRASRSPAWPAASPRAASSNSPTKRCSPTPSTAASDSDRAPLSPIFRDALDRHQYLRHGMLTANRARRDTRFERRFAGVRFRSTSTWRIAAVIVGTVLLP